MRIELLKPHTHAGVLHVPGDILNIDQEAARWLIETGVARPAESIPHPPNRTKGD